MPGGCVWDVWNLETKLYVSLYDIYIYIFNTIYISPKAKTLFEAKNLSFVGSLSLDALSEMSLGVGTEPPSTTRVLDLEEAKSFLWKVADTDGAIGFLPGGVLGHLGSSGFRGKKDGRKPFLQV